MAAQSLHRSQTFLGEFFRRMRARLGAPKAITAAAHKLARIIYHLLITRQPYDESIFIAEEIRFHKRKEARLRAQARELGFQLVPVEAAPVVKTPPPEVPADRVKALRDAFDPRHVMPQR